MLSTPIVPKWSVLWVISWPLSDFLDGCVIHWVWRAEELFGEGKMLALLLGLSLIVVLRSCLNLLAASSTSANPNCRLVNDIILTLSLGPPSASAKLVLYASGCIAYFNEDLEVRLLNPSLVRCFNCSSYVICFILSLLSLSICFVKNDICFLIYSSRCKVAFDWFTLSKFLLCLYRDSRILSSCMKWSFSLWWLFHYELVTLFLELSFILPLSRWRLSLSSGAF